MSTATNTYDVLDGARSSGGMLDYLGTIEAQNHGDAAALACEKWADRIAYDHLTIVERAMVREFPISKVTKVTVES